MSKINSITSLTVDSRLDWVDVAKGIGIILVVFAHVNYTTAILNTIYSFHMPLFFIISGMLYNKNKYTSFALFIKRKLQTLICPYIFFYSLILIYTYVTRSLVQGFSSFSLSNFANDFIQMFLSQGSSKVVSAPLWFVLCLFAVEIIYFFVSKLNKKLIIAICAFLVCAGWLFETFVVSDDKILLPWSIDSAMFALGFYAIGNLFSGYLARLLAWINNLKLSVLVNLGFALISLAVTVPFALYNGHVSMGSKVLNNGFVFYLTGLTGSLCVFFFSNMLKFSKFLAFCGRNSFCIMAIHYPIRSTYIELTKVVNKLYYAETSLVQTIIPFIIVLVLSLLFTVIYGKIKKIILSKKICK